MEKTLQPAIRFQGFTDDWEQRKVDEVSKRVIVGLATSVTPYYREEGVPILRNLNIKENYLDDADILFLDRPYAESQISKQIHTGDVLTVHTGYIGTSCIVPEKYDKCLTFTTLITTTDDAVLEGAFLAQYLNSEIGMSAVQAVTTQGGRQNLNTNDFVKVEIRYPSLAEQSKICALLSSIDDLITLHQRKCEQLKNVKKSMLEKMFPKDGEVVPEIRFSGFTAPWEQRKLGELVQFSKGTGYSKADLKEFGTPIILYGRLYTKYETVIADVDTFADAKQGSVYSRGGEVIVPASGETAEDISIASVVEKSGVLLGGDLNVITPSADLDSAFLAISISNGKPHENMAKMAQGKSVVHLHNTDLEKIDLAYPSHEEQAQISGLFRDIDNLITLHQRKFELLQNVKKSMLEKMFV